MNPKEDDVVMCTVKSIDGPTVFLQIEGNGEASMSMSEVAAGRIRNLREYVFPNKKVVCKVLIIDADGHIHLSLRRVTGKEREIVIEHHKKERTLVNLIAAIIKNPAPIINKIKEEYNVAEFIDQARLDPKILEKFMKKEDAVRLSVMIAEKEGKDKEVREIVTLKTTMPDGLGDIKKILDFPEIEIRYLGSSQFSIAATAPDFKEANTKVNAAIQEIEKRAKEIKAQFELKKK